MSTWVIERRYGKHNYDYLSELTARQTTWASHKLAVVFDDIGIASAAFLLVTQLAAKWPDREGFGFTISEVDEARAARDSATKPSPSLSGDDALPPLKTFIVTIEQPMVTRIVVEAPSDDDAEQVATELYETEPHHKLTQSFGEWVVLGIEEVQP